MTVEINDIIILFIRKSVELLDDIMLAIRWFNKIVFLFYCNILHIIAFGYIEMKTILFG